MTATDTYTKMFEHLLASEGAPARTHEFAIPTKMYTDPRLLQQEQALLQRVPIPVAHVSQLADPGSCLVEDALGVPLLISRDTDGQLHGFLNVCRHRGTRLVEQAGFCRKKSFVCPYHGWTYDLPGELVHVPEQHTFPALRTDEHGLRRVQVAEHGGFVWVTCEPDAQFNTQDFFEPIVDDLVDLGIPGHVVFRESRLRRQTNWKLVIDAFLDGYHIKKLHQNTVFPFFKKYLIHTERVGSHIRSIVSRTEFRQRLQQDPASWNVREMTSPTYHLFPNTILVVHPDFISRLLMFPVSPSETEWVHTMLIPEAPRTDAEIAHWNKSWDLIEGGVFQSEDLWVCEQIQRGLNSGANETFRFGGLETGIEWFHQTLASALNIDLDTHID